ncbi:MAG: tetratricopeptide repeat protein [Candidatus Lindowbacteria bacterium]|nr:tetratricopeptide repeat protein [Candidatus Lindowbacteria bacterium]
MSEGTQEVRKSPGLSLYSEYTGRFARMIEEDPNKALDEYGYTYLYSVDDPDSAAFLRAIDQAEDSWRQRFLETVNMHKRGKLDEAEASYKKLMSEDETHKEVEYNLAALYLQRGDLDVATKHLENFENYIKTVPETVPYAQECKIRIEEFKEELREF